MAQGRAVVLKKPGERFIIEEFPVPDPEPGAVLIRMTQAGLCGSDLHLLHPGAISLVFPPGGRVIGHEGNGVVAKLGKGVTTDSAGLPIKEGDRVIHSAVQPCGRCYDCQQGQPNWCPSYPGPREAGVHPYFVGTFADYYYSTPQQAVYKVPDDVPDASLSFVNCAMGTVTEGLIAAGAAPGKSVVLFGAGGLGLNAAGVARHMGVDQVIILDRQPKRLELAKAFGADVILNIDEYATKEARLERVKQLTGGRGADIVMDLVGSARIQEEGPLMLANGGTYVQIGAIGPGETATIPSGAIARGRKMMGSLMYKPQRIPMLLQLLQRERGRMPFDKIVSSSYSLDQVNEAFEQADWKSHATDVTRAVIIP